MKETISFLIFLIIFSIPSISLSTTLLPNIAGDSEGTCIEGDCNNGEGTWEYSRGGKYVGQFQNGQPHGKGKLTLINGMTINGGFNKGLPHGKATTVSSDGANTINIIWKNGEMVQVVSNEADFETDETEVTNKTETANETEVTEKIKLPEVTDETNTIDANDELTISSRGKCIQGDCVNGYGTMIFPNGKKHVGRFKDKMKHGRGAEGQEGGDGKFGYWLYDMYVGKERPEELEEK